MTQRLIRPSFWLAQRRSLERIGLVAAPILDDAFIPGRILVDRDRVGGGQAPVDADRAFAEPWA